MFIKHRANTYVASFQSMGIVTLLFIIFFIIIIIIIFGGIPQAVLQGVKGGGRVILIDNI